MPKSDEYWKNNYLSLIQNAPSQTWLIKEAQKYSANEDELKTAITNGLMKELDMYLEEGKSSYTEAAYISIMPDIPIISPELMTWYRNEIDRKEKNDTKFLLATLQNGTVADYIHALEYVD